MAYLKPHVFAYYRVMKIQVLFVVLVSHSVSLSGLLSHALPRYTRKARGASLKKKRPAART
jgi:hypothetical protein